MSVPASPVCRLRRIRLAIALLIFFRLGLYIFIREKVDVAILEVNYPAT